MQLLLEQSRVNSPALWFNKFHYYLRTKHSFPPPLCTADSQTFVDCFITRFAKSPSNCGLIRLLLPSLLEDNLLSLPLSTSAASQKPSPWLQTSQESSAMVPAGDEWRKKQSLVLSVRPIQSDNCFSYMIFSNTLGWCDDWIFDQKA